MNLPVNRHQRRRAIALGTLLPAVIDPPAMTGPTPRLRILLIDGADRSIKQIIMEMKPSEITKVLRGQKVSWAKLGEIDERVHIMLAGDPTEQIHDIGHRWFEPEFQVLDADMKPGPVLHGRAIVFGYAPALNKAASTPVNPVWLEERVRWLEPGAFARLKDETIAPQLEDQSGEVGQGAEPGSQGLPALPSDGSVDGPALRD